MPQIWHAVQYAAPAAYLLQGYRQGADAASLVPGLYCISIAAGVGLYYGPAMRYY